MTSEYALCCSHHLVYLFMRRSLIDGFTTLCIYSYAYYKVILDSYSNYYLV
jgi:hypothetical protein